MLHLNCDRLCQARLRIFLDIEKNKKRQREQRIAGPQGMANLAKQYFQRPWPAFFTTIRILLGQAAEDYLSGIEYNG